MSDLLIMRDFINNDRPRERLLEKGGEALSDSELLAIVLNSGGRGQPVTELSRILLKKYSSLKNILETDIEQLKKEKFIGISKAAGIKAVCEICKRVNNEEGIKQIKIEGPKDAYRVIRKDIYAKEQEYLFLLSLDSRKNLISKDLICIGSINETLVPLREIFKKALQKNAVFLILTHNHPSNDPTPSAEDINVTQKMSEGAKLLGLTFLDHIIATNSSFVSIKSLNGVI